MSLIKTWWTSLICSKELLFCRQKSPLKRFIQNVSQFNEQWSSKQACWSVIISYSFTQISVAFGKSSKTYRCFVLCDWVTQFIVAKCILIPSPFQSLVLSKFLWRAHKCVLVDRSPCYQPAKVHQPVFLRPSGVMLQILGNKLRHNCSDICEGSHVGFPFSHA